MTIIKTETISLLDTEKRAFDLVDTILENVKVHGSNPDLIAIANRAQWKLNEFLTFCVEEK